MPILFIHLLEGRSRKMKNDLIARVTEAVTGTLKVTPDKVRVILRDVSPDDWGVAGQPLSPAKKKIK